MGFQVHTGLRTMSTERKALRFLVACGTTRHLRLFSDGNRRERKTTRNVSGESLWSESTVCRPEEQRRPKGPLAHGDGDDRPVPSVLFQGAWAHLCRAPTWVHALKFDRAPADAFNRARPCQEKVAPNRGLRFTVERLIWPAATAGVGFWCSSSGFADICCLNAGIPTCLKKWR